MRASLPPIKTRFKSILCLDQAIKTGWAYYNGATTQTGVEDFSRHRGESQGWVFIRFQQFLQKFPAHIDVIVYEQSHHRGGDATQIGVGMVACILAFCAERGSEYKACHSATLKKFITGKGSADKSLMGAVAKQRWSRTFRDDNECDAFCLLMWALAGCPESAKTPKKRRAGKAGEPAITGETSLFN